MSNNTSAISLYKKYNFIKYGENPKAFLNRENKYQSINQILKQKLAKEIWYTVPTFTMMIYNQKEFEKIS